VTNCANEGAENAANKANSAAEEKKRDELKSEHGMGDLRSNKKFRDNHSHLILYENNSRLQVKFQKMRFTLYLVENEK
jgi:hypothetical protein